MTDDFYRVLGVEVTATQPEIKQAYRALARQLHPDKNPGNADAESKFKDVAEAYRVLGDADLRADYDRHRRGSKGGIPATESAEDVLDELFGTRKARKRASSDSGQREAPRVPREPREQRDNRQRAPEPPPRQKSTARVRDEGRGTDYRYRLEVSFEEAALGTEAEIVLPSTRRCANCGGTGSRPGTAVRLCEGCHGSGTIRVQQGFFDKSERCPDCGGSGRRSPKDCPACQGQGTETVERAITIPVPAGVSHGTRLRVQGEGGGGGADLYVVVDVRPDALFQREKDDVVTEVPVSFVEAALGAQIEIPTLEGKVRMRIPPGSQHGRVFRLKGKGFLGASGARGDQRVRIAVDVPAALTDSQRELLERFAETEAAHSTNIKVDEFRRALRERYG
jgi:molecular chaperone DnaJ